jgi:hypothetical protein
MNVIGVLLKMSVVGEKYSLELRDMTEEQFYEAIKALDIPVVFEKGNLSKPIIGGMALGSWESGGKL